MVRSPVSTTRCHPPARRWLLLLPTALLAACIAEPPRERRGPLVSAQRILALDFGSHRANDRLRDLERAPAALRSELLRTRTIAGELPAVFGEADRPLALWQDATRAAQSELRRYPHNLGRYLPTQHELAQRTADSLYAGMRLFGSSLHPLGEISDREHRTDHTDDRPEVSLLDRIWRRLGL